MQNNQEQQDQALLTLEELDLLIRKLRLSRKDVAKMLKIPAGQFAQLLERWIRNRDERKRVPQKDTRKLLSKLALILGVSEDRLWK